MAEELALGVAETLQTSHINPHPDPAYDANPSTAASKKVPVRFRAHAAGDERASPSSEPPNSSDEISIDILEPQPRNPAMPPLPDLRFEQSYLARIKPFADAGDYRMVAFYTVWDNVVLPLTQGLIWRLAVFGWRAFNTGTHFKGRGTGARLRRWWWGVNGWSMPANGKTTSDDVAEFVVNKFGNAGAD